MAGNPLHAFSEVSPLTDAQLRAQPIDVYAERTEAVVARTSMWDGKVAHLYTIIGHRAGWNSTTVLGDVAQYLSLGQNNLNPTSVATQYYLRSTSASDTSVGPGIGAQTVRIVYLDGAGVQRVVTPSLNGTTGVALPFHAVTPALQLSYIQWMEIGDVGSNEVSVGALSVSSVAGGPGTESTTIAYIAAGGNRSMDGRFKVPAGHTAYMLAWNVDAINADMDMRIRAKVFMDDSTASPSIHFLDNAYLSLNSGRTRDMFLRVVPALCEIKLFAIPGAAAAGNRAAGTFYLICREN